ncbi:hypothetical protein PHO31112_02611 [Pandoraea horticolens]|uniref:Uncharacterized protein n=1 Tax=Pandoraea horticolens TaxID=2508298 RepID=A0A5E4VF19_9BURK|nr:hypothetical protein PHO31112_02611 [Pandoraea horticolens]
MKTRGAFWLRGFQDFGVLLWIYLWWRGGASTSRPSRYERAAMQVYPFANAPLRFRT